LSELKGKRGNIVPEEKDTIAIIGLGRVGTAMGILLQAAGYPVTAVSSRSAPPAGAAVEPAGALFHENPADAAAQARCVLITTSDDAIAPVCERIARSGAVGPGKKVVHMSGAGGLDLLATASRKGAFVACIHPIQAFANAKSALSSIPGSTFGITADEAIRDWAVGLVRDIGGVPFFVPGNRKALYHAAACIASNYLVTLLYVVSKIGEAFGLAERETLDAYGPLVRGTIRNIEEHGTISALTGPIARGDGGTVARHFEAFKESLPRYLDAYRALGEITVDMAVEKKTVAPEKAETIRSILKGGKQS